MAVDVGTERISPRQRRLLAQARAKGLPIDYLIEMLMDVSRDEDIRSGHEQLHIEWAGLYSACRSRLSKNVRNSLLEEMDQIFLHEGIVSSSIKHINPAESNICFLLGAGASKPAPSDIPTVKELLPDLLDSARRLDREEVTKLVEFCHESEINNIEDLLTAVQISRFCSRNQKTMDLVEFLLFREDLSDRRMKRGRRSSVHVSAVALLQDTLQILFGLLSNRMLPAEPNKGHEAIAKYVEAHSNGAVITTNYDCCIDLAMIRHEVLYSYDLEFENDDAAFVSSDSSVNLLKLHGSLNWFYCETCQDVRSVDIEETTAGYNKDRIMYPVIGACRSCGGQRRGLLIPPLAMKFDMPPPLNPLIEKATVCFSKADVIVVVGFSFADADLYISRMISKAVKGNSNTKVLIFDPDYNVYQRVRRQFKVRIPNFDSSRILRVLGDCSDTLPKFLSGEFYERDKDVEQMHS